MAILRVTRSTDGRYMVCLLGVFYLNIGGVERGESTGTGADN